MAKDDISGHGKDYVLSRNKYEAVNQKSMDEWQESKDAFKGGEFKKSFIHNNACYSDKPGVSERSSFTRLHTTGDKYLTEINDYKLFLGDPDELPRLSILDNYKQITRIMTSQYIKSSEEEKKFRNRSSVDVDVDKDADYARYQEARTNTMKMSTTLKTLNSPRKKRKAVTALRQKQAEEEAENLRRRELAEQKTYKKYAHPGKRSTNVNATAVSLGDANHPLSDAATADEINNISSSRKDEKHAETAR